MLARTSKVHHPLGAVIDLPRLVPAFSSKGFPFLKNGGGEENRRGGRGGRSKAPRSRRPADKRTISETTLALELTAPYIRDSILLSAYDLHHKHFRKPEKYFQGKEVIFLDSGGYELSPGFDQTEPVHWGTPKKAFSERDYLAVLAKLPSDLPFSISNFDWGSRRRTIPEQVMSAQRLFRRFPAFLKDFIVKPGDGRRYIDMDEVIRHVKKFRGFDILGVTEKELGEDTIDRLIAVARLRLALDRENMSIPIHVWGGLDPLLTPLYFFAGAEIFDGISWLRYAYIDGVAVYRDSYNLLVDGIENPTDKSRVVALSHNLSFLRRLATHLGDFALHNGTRFDMFGTRAEALEKAYRVLVTRVPEAEGGR